MKGWRGALWDAGGVGGGIVGCGEDEHHEMRGWEAGHCGYWGNGIVGEWVAQGVGHCVMAGAGPDCGAVCFRVERREWTRLKAKVSARGVLHEGPCEC